MTPNQFAQAIQPNISKYIPKDHRPYAKQMVFMALAVKEAGYGGATGGGKSDALLMDALQGVHIPGYAALLLRRTYSDLSLPGALMDRAAEWFTGTNARWIDKTKTWSFPTEGKENATLSFGFMETDKDRLRYQGSELQYVGYDEATQFSELQYTYLYSRCRYTKKLLDLISKAGTRLPLKVRSATNPGGPGHIWYKQRFINAKKNRCVVHPLYDGVALPTNKCKNCEDYFDAIHRVFVPSGLKDNPHIDQVSYLEMLKELDPVTREQYINGNWDATEGGGMFSRTWLTSHPNGTNHLFPFYYAKKQQFTKICRFWDLAGTKVSTLNSDPDWTAGVLIGITEEKKLWILDVRRIRENPGVVVDFVKETAEEDLAVWGDLLRIRIELEPGSSGKFLKDDFTKDHLMGFDIRFTKSTGKKHVRARPFATSCYNGAVYCVNAIWNDDFFDELEMFCEENTGHDDQVDACTGGFKELVVKGTLSVGSMDEVAEAKALMEAAKQQYDGNDPTVKLQMSPEYEAAMERGRMFGFDGGV